MSKPNESFLRGDYNCHHHHHQQQAPHVHLPPHLPYTSSNLSKAASREQASNSLHPQPPSCRVVSSAGGTKGVGQQPGKLPHLLPPIGASPSPYNTRVVNFDSHPTWEDLQHADVTCATAPAEGKATRGRSHSSLMHGKLNPPPHHTELMSTGTRAAK